MRLSSRHPEPRTLLHAQLNIVEPNFGTTKTEECQSLSTDASSPILYTYLNSKKQGPFELVGGSTIIKTGPICGWSYEGRES